MECGSRSCRFRMFRRCENIQKRRLRRRTPYPLGGATIYTPRLMCGLTGMIAPAATTAEELSSRVRPMCDALVHRGPDDEGAWIDAQAGVALGFRRLAILDLSAAGHQPMVSHSGRYVATLNGEIYNFEALRPELPGPWRGHSDTEVMLAAFDAWGIEAALQKFIGSSPSRCGIAPRAA